VTHTLAELLDHDSVDRLKPYAITEIEDLVGVLESDHQSVGRLLHLTDAEVNRLHAKALEQLSPDAQKELAQAHARQVAFGAWNPDEVS